MSHPHGDYFFPFFPWKYGFEGTEKDMPSSLPDLSIISGAESLPPPFEGTSRVYVETGTQGTQGLGAILRGLGIKLPRNNPD